MLDLKVSRLGNITVVEAQGRIDSMSALSLQEALIYEIEKRHSRIILDLSQINYLSGAGLRLLNDLNERVGEVRLARPSDRVREVLQISGLDAVFQSYETLLAAVRSIAPVTNAHTHLELGFLASYRPGVTGAPFMEWLSGLVARRGKLGAEWDSLAEKSIEAGIQSLMDSGTTMVGDISATGKSIKPLLESGLQGIVYVEVIGPYAAEVDERLARAQALIDQWRPKERNGMRVGLTIHAPYSTHPDLWRKALDYARAEALPLCIHAAESPEELEFLTRGSGVMAEFSARVGGEVTVPMTTPIRYLEDLGALELKPLLVHAVQVNDDDLRRIKASGASVAHCPRSNLLLRCGRMPLEKYLMHGIPVYLGTDSLASSPSLNIFDELDTAAALHYGVVPPEAIERLVYRPLT